MSGVIVQKCDFINVGKYPITIGYDPGNYDQRYWSYDNDGVVLDYKISIGDIPEILEPGAFARGSIAYHSDAEKVIVCPLDPTTI